MGWPIAILFVSLVACINLNDTAVERIEPVFERIGGGDGVIRATIQASANNKIAVGVGVLPLSSRTPMEFQFPKPVSFILFRTKHRQVPIHLDRPSQIYRWDYTPVTWLERDPGELSPLDVTAVTEEAEEFKGLYVWEQDNGLKARIHCNGEQWEDDGMSICQSYQGLLQEIVFTEPTRVLVANPDCQPVDINKGFRWHYVMQPGACTFRFESLADPSKHHRHVSRGYEHVESH